MLLAPTVDEIQALLPHLTAAEQAELNALLAAGSGDVPQTDDELWWYLADTWGVRIPRVQVCLHHVAPFTFFAGAFFARASVIVLKASRGLGGKSFMLSYLGLAQAHLLGAQVVILGGSMKQSQQVHGYMRDAWDYPGAPRICSTN
jgi:hypothetical protein